VIDSSLADSIVSIDTILFDQTNQFTNITPVDDTLDYELTMSQKPAMALFKSMALPGWGQLGNRRYIKAAVFAGLDVWFISSALRYKSNAKDFRELYLNEDDLVLRGDYYDKFDSERDQRNKYTWYAVITAFFAMFDAYVDAHLSGYPRKENENSVGLQVYPDDYGTMMTAVTLTF
jgi:hypothetical protein